MKNTIYFDIKQEYDYLKEQTYDAIINEQNNIGYYALPEQDTSMIHDFVSKFNEQIDTVAILGIGGSSLGTKAIYEFLKPKNKFSRELVFFESTDPLSIKYEFSKLDLAKTHFIVVSKSGTTIETIALFKYIYNLSDSKHFTFITDENSALYNLAQSINCQIFTIPQDVGGRFSVLSSVGLVPLALCNVDIDKLLAGARNIKNEFLERKNFFHKIVDKAIFYAKNSNTYNISCIFAYSESLKYFCEWYVQLWGESLGKKQTNSILNVGLTPIGLIGPRDQHSFLQLLVDGHRDKCVTFIKIEDFNENLIIPDVSFEFLDSLDSINNISFEKLINLQCESTIESLQKCRDIPIDKIILKSIEEYSIGEIIFYYELLTSCIGILLGVNTYNQPGVEAGKIILKSKLNTNQK